jgi:hypothetical protein
MPMPRKKLVLLEETPTSTASHAVYAAPFYNYTGKSYEH